MKKLLIVFAAIIITVGSMLAVYAGSYYHADESAMTCVEDGADGISITLEKNGNYIFAPENPENTETGFIFYPGGKVQCEAYAPLMCRLAQNGICCILVHMPSNLAIFDIDAADGLQTEFPSAKRWFIGGHSLGGVSAAMYLEKHAEEYDGLVLLGAYSTSDLSQTGLSVLSVYGENDGIMSREKYEDCRKNLPEDFTELVIEGGCHSGFGSYGKPEGDGAASCSADDQQKITAEAITGLVFAKGK